jgi:futalosine hydrolase
MEARPVIVCAASLEGLGLADAVLGVGKAAAAMRATELLVRARPAWLLLIGVCGAYPPAPGGPALAVGDLCLVGEDRLADEGVGLAGGEFRGIAALGLGDEGPFRADPARTKAIAARLGIPIVAGATVSTCSGSDDLSRAVAGRSGAQVETMEGAAVLQVCHHLEVPAVQLRCVSNRSGERPKGGWNLGDAVTRLHAAVRVLASAGGWEGVG